ncbi:similar to cytoplasmic dynein 1 intermediate chain 2 [Plenodomus lingam JN3]|uniref:Similar to cytoplasmic dynein 1 intermediate chain 2 n=1 Tax=Leptosphaeria maculans (strain JN3 / isolate v23.1.3 / race Av1-4-5-6-7-8) TaxID=985895 RepID=E4ZVT9_LEPMJ|nr:similar to cytoplasmic dynein 1 intermediate chain 2 [Plenodomus lingam JN3]CBX95715.1 similar to cytoplasmic dynein 1 intermediate chain 2 [Plenodomus lingam JN3]
MESTVQQRRDEILAKKAKLAELKRQRELRRQEQANRQSYNGSPSGEANIEGKRADVNNLINSILNESRPSSTQPGSPAGPGRAARPESIVSAGQLSSDNEGPTGYPASLSSMVDREMQTLSIGPLATVYEFDGQVTNEVTKEKEVITYSKGVQASIEWSPHKTRGAGGSDTERDESPTRSPKSKRLSRRQKEKDEEIRMQLRKEIEEELKAAQQAPQDGAPQTTSEENFPFKTLTNEELAAVENSEEFIGFVERSTKVLERALDQQLEYDILADYALGGVGVDDEDEGYGSSGGKKGRRIKEIAQFWDDRWSKKRMISDLGFSTKFPELVLASYTKNPSAPHDPDGLVQVWNLHMHDRPEYIFHAQSDILTAKFSPFHPNLIIGGAYSGQVLLWDTRAKSAPIQKTPLTGSDGVVCGWTVDMLSQPQEFLELTSPPPAKTDDMAVTCIAFPQSDPTYFLAGTEEGSIYPCHRYDRAGAKAGVDGRVKYGGHAAPVMSLDFHPAKGQIDLGDLVLSSSVDWSVKLWKVRPPAATGAANTTLPGTAQQVTPVLDIAREDLVYDARWSPVKPSVFALVDGAGSLEVWDINVDMEVPMQSVKPSDGKKGAFANMPTGLGYMNRSLNKLAWEKNEGRRVAVGGMDGVVTVFEVGNDLGGVETRSEEWSGVKRLVSRMEGVGEGTGK